MSYSPLSIETFGGLDVSRDPVEVGASGAIDLLNVDFDTPGVLRTRDGTENWSDAAATDFSTLFGVNYGTRGLLSHRVADPVAPGADFVRFGTPTTSYVYLTNRAASGTFEYRTVAGGAATASVAAAGQIQRWSGSAFSSPAGLATISPHLLEVQAPDNRLVAANTSTNQHRVMFSNAGAAETFGANDYVDLTPGDGEEIMALASYRELLFAFKQTKFFVFTGNSTGGDGNPVFNNRQVNTGIGCSYLYGATVGEDGVYFAHHTGIYRTDGGPAVRVSPPVDTMFRREAGATATTYVGHITRVDDRILVGMSTDPDGTNVGTAPVTTLVYNTRTGQWSEWNIAAISYTGLATEGDQVDEQTLLFAPFGTSRVRQHTKGLATDGGSAMASRYQSGWYEPAPGQESFTRWTRLWGTGSPTVDVYTDFATSDPLSRGGAVTLGTDPTVAMGFHQKSYQGRLFSHRISASSGAWRLNRLQHDVAVSRP